MNTANNSPADDAVDFIILETERLYLREFNIDDTDAVYSYSGNAENTWFMDWGPDSPEDVEDFIKAKLAQQLASPRKIFDLAVCLKSSRRLIGSCSLMLDEKRQQAELGYILHRDFQHMGFATEAAKSLLHFGFMSLDLHRIYAHCDSENTASESVMMRLGMRKEADRKSCVHTIVGQRKQWRGQKEYAMLQKEYLLKTLGEQ